MSVSIILCLDNPFAKQHLTKTSVYNRPEPFLLEKRFLGGAPTPPMARKNAVGGGTRIAPHPHTQRRKRDERREKPHHHPHRPACPAS
eukprot:6362248-Prymnesium_polylepis.1